MKNSMLLFSLLLMSCELLIDTDTKYLPDTRDNAGVVLQTRVISSDQTNVLLEADIVLLDYYNIGDISFLSKNSFSVSPLSTGIVSIQNFEAQRSFSFPERSSTIILIDQSGDYETYDPFNNRSKAINKLMEDLTSQQVIVGGFSTGGLVAEPVQYSAETFGLNREEQLPFLFGLAAKTGGKNNLYDALNSALEKLKLQTGSGDIVVLSSGNDSGSSQTLNAILQKASALNIRIHIVHLGDAPSSTIMSGLSRRLNSVFAACPDSKTMITVLGSLARLANRQSSGYRIRINYRKSSGSFSPGEEISFAVNVTDSYDNYTYNPIVITHKMP